MVLIGHSLGTAEGRLLAVDPQICEIMHREERELIGITFQSLTHRDDLDRNVAALMALRVQDGPLSLRKRYIRPDGSAVWSSIKVSRLRSDDGSRLVGTIQMIDAPTSIRDPFRLMRSAKQMAAVVVRRRQELTDELFSDYAWLILLQIYLAEAEGRVAGMSQIIESVSMRPALAERWFRVLEDRGLVERTEWTGYTPQLTAAGILKVERVLSADFND